MEIAILVFLIYIALILTLILSYVHFFFMPHTKILVNGKETKTALLAKAELPMEESVSDVGVIIRPSAKRLRMINDPKKQEEHDAFMGVLDNEPVLRASREATKVSQKGYIQK